MNSWWDVITRRAKKARSTLALEHSETFISKFCGHQAGKVMAWSASLYRTGLRQWRTGNNETFIRCDALWHCRTKFVWSSMLHPVDSWWSNKRAIWDTYLVSIPQQRSMLQTNIWRRQEVSSGRNILCALPSESVAFVRHTRFDASTLAPKTTADFGLRNFARVNQYWPGRLVYRPIYRVHVFLRFLFFWDCRKHCSSSGIGVQKLNVQFSAKC